MLWGVGHLQLSTDGALQSLAFDEASAKRYRIVPGSGTSIQTALAAAK